MIHLPPWRPASLRSDKCKLQNIQNYNAQLDWMHKDKWVPIWCPNRSVIHVHLFSGTKFITDCIIFMLAFIVLIFNIQVLYRLLLSLIVCKISYVSYFSNMQCFFMHVWCCTLPLCILKYQKRYFRIGLIAGFFRDSNKLHIFRTACM